MKGKDIINNIVFEEMPEKEQLKQNIHQAANITKKRSVNFGVKRLVPIALCLVVVLTAVVVLPYVIKDENVPGVISEVSNNNNMPVDPSLRGLPVDNFNLANVRKGSSFTRIGFFNFGNIFKYNVEYFVVVRITDTHIQKKSDDQYYDHQISDAYILKNIYNDIESSTIQITQSIIENHFCLGTTNLLRKGGVYLLPLWRDDNIWYNMSDMDVQFEIDDKGIVWSHSNFKNFNRFDGKNVETLIGELQEMVTDEEYMLANSTFSRIMQNWTLADITITSISNQKTDKYGNGYFNYTFDVHEILSKPNHDSLFKSIVTEQIKVYTLEAETIKLNPGYRYLIFLDKSNNEIYVNELMISKIGSDEIITVMHAPDNLSDIGTSIFAPYDGYKLSDFREMVSRINAWNEAQESKVN